MYPHPRQSELCFSLYVNFIIQHFPKQREKGSLGSEIVPVLHNPSSAALRGKESLPSLHSYTIPGGTPDCSGLGMRPSGQLPRPWGESTTIGQAWVMCPLL